MSENRYRVVVNDDGQYSVWREDADIPPGWHAAGASGSKSECLDHIGRTWSGIRPGGRAR